MEDSRSKDLRERRIHLTDIELIMLNELNNRNLRFEYQFPTRSGFILDFAFPEVMLGIECDGEKWHKPGNKRDRMRDYILRRGEWTIMRFTENEIKTDIPGCVDKIIEQLSILYKSSC